jgi:hypothetical protein
MLQAEISSLFHSSLPFPALLTWHVGVRVAGRHGELRGHGVSADGLENQGVCLRKEK